MASTYKKELNQLSAIRVSRLEEPGLYADGGGLGLQIVPGSRSWVFRFQIAGKPRKMGLGPYPAISLAMARDMATQYRTMVKQGIDPVEARKMQKAIAVPAAKEKTFDECATAYIETHRGAWKNPKHAQQWANTVASYASPHFGSKPVSAINTELVLKALKEIWADKNETATRVRGRIENILDWAAAQKFRSGDNPARWRGHLEHLLADPSKIAPVKHHPALPFVRMASFMLALRALDSLSAAALELTILTAARTNEILGAVPSEFNLKKRIWTIPAERMKAPREHRVPLSARATQLVGQRIEIAKIEKSGLLFPGKSKRGEIQPLSDMAMLEVVRGLPFGHITVHGFRSTFRDWAGECTEYPSDVVEMALAHRVANATEAAYRRGDMLERRVPLMDDWEKFCLAKLR